MREMAIILCAVLSVINLAFTTFTTSRPIMASMDEKRIQALFIRQLAEHKASPEKIRTATIKFQTSLAQVLQSWCKNKRVIVMDKRYVLAGTADITDEIIELLALEMRRQAS